MSDGEYDSDQLRSLFDRPRALTFGVEEEVMVLDPSSLDLAPCARELLRRVEPSAQYKLELPAAQIEIVTPPRQTITELTADLLSARRELSRALAGDAALLAAGVHPFAAEQGQLNAGAHYDQVAEEYGPVARRQLVCGLHLHACLSGAERVLGVYNALRSYLPELAALAANAPLYGGCDSGMASVRPLISGLLPRQGVPPAYESWEHLAADLAWGARAGRLARLRGWWWELRLHADLGTIEVRVPDAQSLALDATAVAAVAAALVVWLAERYDARELEPPAPAWRIAENRWSAARHGLHGEMRDLVTAAAAPTRERIAALLDELVPCAARIGAVEELERARRLAAENGADRQRRLFAASGVDAVVAELAARFDEPSSPA